MKIGLLGLGTVGTGVYEIINHQKGNYFASSKERAIITKVLVNDINKSRSINIPPDLLTNDFNEILNDEDIQVVIAVMGGMEPEYSYMLAAMEKGKHVITANKAVVSEHMDILLKTAQSNNVSFLFEASVGGGVPIINSLNQTLRINEINEIKGILNGTTNFILSKMTYEGWDFDFTLKTAQKLGFAEADPTADVDGFDVSRKLSILSSMAFGAHINDDMIYKRGIRDVTRFDIDMFKNLGYVLKYLAHSKLENDTYYMTVEPILLTTKDLMSNVNEEFNIISINGNIIGELNFYGKGAGKDATANSVVGDLLYIINSEFKKIEIQLDKNLKNGGISGFKGNYYLRADVKDHDEFSLVLDIIDEYSIKKKMEFSGKKLYIITEEMNAETFNELAGKIKSANINNFYARIH
ncbi:MAG TPA: homoserine dehydrogenase [Eubacteriaceae bacterium]|nr:homoserine dehydrogenase [Eubacteriaceae bacterium]